MVTADTILHTYAVVVWEKVVSNEIDSFFIYRRNGFGLYDKIGATHYSQPGEFYDYGVDLGQNLSGLYKYKISVLDTCGNESLKSRFHKPIHLTYTGSGSFNYDDYEIELLSSNYFFELYMDVTGVGNSWQIINSVPPGTFVMDDPSFSSHPGAVYHVRAVLPDECDPTRVGVNTSRSNIKNQSISNNMDEISVNEISIFPVPANDFIQINHSGKSNINKIEIYNTIGQLLIATSQPSNSVNVNDLDEGIYSLKIYFNDGIAVKNFIKN